MTILIKHVLAWMVYSTQFKKWAGVIGGFCVGAYVQGNYWREIASARSWCGVSKDAMNDTLLAVAGACGIAASVALSLAKTRMDKAGHRGKDRRGKRP